MQCESGSGVGGCRRRKLGRKIGWLLQNENWREEKLEAGHIRGQLLGLDPKDDLGRIHPKKTSAK